MYNTLAGYMLGQFSLLQYLEFFLRIFTSCICGACIGFERTKRLKEAGVRTHVIVCCAAALTMIVSKYAFADMTLPGGASFSGWKVVVDGKASNFLKPKLKNGRIVLVGGSTVIFFR